MRQLICAAALLIAPAVASAQAPPAPQTPVAPKVDRVDRVDPNSCANPGAQATIGPGGDIDVSKKDGRNLSDQLARSGGVICPPGRVDSEIHAPTPPGGAMQVIPPPGSPGGDPNVQPK
jgi:hypothetical protein